MRALALAQGGFLQLVVSKDFIVGNLMGFLAPLAVAAHDSYVLTGPT